VQEPREFFGRPIESVQAAVVRTNPKVSGTILQNRPHPVITQTIRIRIEMPEVGERFRLCIKTVETPFRADPNGALSIAVDRVDIIVAETRWFFWIVSENTLVSG